LDTKRHGQARSGTINYCKDAGNFPADKRGGIKTPINSTKISKVAQAFLPVIGFSEMLFDEP
jgi:hypothetical protein